MITFKTRLRKTLLAFLILFCVMFILRLIYGFVEFPNNEMPGAGNFSTMSDNSNFESGGLLNIASRSYKFEKSAAQAVPQVVEVDQKYEKTATVSCLTSDFAKEEEEIKERISAANGIIQFEQKSGNEGNRFLSWQIGIPPEVFDEFVEGIKSSYNVQSISITKKDKTNEYRELNARRATLVSTRDALVELKSKGGQIEEYINLENRILQIDEQLRDLGVQLGSFDAENEFCTVKLSLREGQPRQITFVSRLKAAFEWTVEYYVWMMIGFFFSLGTAYVLLRLLDRLGIIKAVKERLQE